ncbi:PhzF family phenazine biosynthesis protein [Candidatus Rhodoluna planktonica]|nr:PhzF family phenazine biosynthesis protein [Candidatus Rhodoluna planktonica]
MRTRAKKFAQVDVFSRIPYLGNPVAVVLDADGLSDESMQRLARWTNLSETTFILSPTTAEADYRLRIFTPGGELPFAGHPTLGSAHAWLENGGKPKVTGQLVQECGVGLVALNQSEEGSQLSFRAPATMKSGPLEPGLLSKIVSALGVDESEVVAHQYVDNGPGWVCVQLTSAARVLAVDPKFDDDSELMLGLLGAYPSGGESAFELRAFAPKIGVYEDPVTGSLNASVAQWLFRTGAVANSYQASQGQRVGRQGTISLSVDGKGEVWVGGPTVTCIRGSIEI